MSFSLNKWNAKIIHIVSGKGETLNTGRTRLQIVRMISMALLALVVIRLGDLTLLQTAGEPTERHNIANHQGLIERRDIVDRNGVLLATTLQVASLYADPSLIENKAYIARSLEDILKIENVESKLNRSGRFVWIKRGITPEDQFAINALGSPGLAFKTETRRFYPQGRVASHVVGYTSIDGKGLAGMELQYNDILQKGRDDLILNLDIRLQHALAKSLRDHMEKFKARGASGGIVDVNTGEVLAAVSLPDFDPHHIGKTSDIQRFNNLTLGIYEMGSTFKLFSTAAYLDHTKDPFAKTFDAREPLKEGRFTINDFHAEKRILTVPEVFIHSSNIGSALMGRMMGNDVIQDYYRDMGLFDRVPTDFPGLGKPMTPKPWRDVNTLTASYGHGIAVTPLHVLQATSVIARGGTTQQLYFARASMQQNDMVEKKILSNLTVHKMRQLLRLNVSKGSGMQADIGGYHVGGKTGTSEKVNPNGGYDSNKLLSSFVGIYPSGEPRYAILAVLDEPQGIKETFGYATGGWTAAPVVGEVVQDMTRILAIPAQGPDTHLTAGLDRYIQDENEQQGGFSPASYRQ